SRSHSLRALGWNRCERCSWGIWSPPGSRITVVSGDSAGADATSSGFSASAAPPSGDASIRLCGPFTPAVRWPAIIELNDRSVRCRCERTDGYGLYHVAQVTKTSCEPNGIPLRFYDKEIIFRILEALNRFLGRLDSRSPESLCNNAGESRAVIARGRTQWRDRCRYPNTHRRMTGPRNAAESRRDPRTSDCRSAARSPMVCSMC